MSSPSSPRRLTTTQRQAIDHRLEAIDTARTAEEEHEHLRAIVATCQSVLLADRAWGRPHDVSAAS